MELLLLSKKKHYHMLCLIFPEISRKIILVAIFLSHQSKHSHPALLISYPILVEFHLHEYQPFPVLLCLQYQTCSNIESYWRIVCRFKWCSPDNIKIGLFALLEKFLHLWNKYIFRRWREREREKGKMLSTSNMNRL